MFLLLAVPFFLTKRASTIARFFLEGLMSLNVPDERISIYGHK